MRARDSRQEVEAAGVLALWVDLARGPLGGMEPAGGPACRGHRLRQRAADAQRDVRSVLKQAQTKFLEVYGKEALARTKRAYRAIFSGALRCAAPRPSLRGLREGRALGYDQCREGPSTSRQGQSHRLLRSVRRSRPPAASS